MRRKFCSLAVVGDSLAPVTAGVGFVVVISASSSDGVLPLDLLEIKDVLCFLENTSEARTKGGVLNALDLPVVVVCVRIWIRSEIRDPPEPLKGRYHHVPASSSRSSRPPLPVSPRIL
ncbi:hypothetical protein Rs2_50685 [Raphanus sativus]|nr:hypothetical protein Rs2_50685 [Raphanus sativus]